MPQAPRRSSLFLFLFALVAAAGGIRAGMAAPSYSPLAFASTAPAPAPAAAGGLARAAFAVG